MTRHLNGPPFQAIWHEHDGNQLCGIAVLAVTEGKVLSFFPGGESLAGPDKIFQIAAVKNRDHFNEQLILSNYSQSYFQ